MGRRSPRGSSSYGCLASGGIQPCCLCRCCSGWILLSAVLGRAGALSMEVPEVGMLCPPTLVIQTALPALR